VEISLQYGLDTNNIHEAAEAAHYKLENPSQYITDQINDIVRGELSKVELDHAFVLKNKLQSEIEARLGENLKDYGFVITKALMTNFTPDKAVVLEMNNIYTQRLIKIVNEQLAETQKMYEVSRAQADSERKELLGMGTSLMRRAYLRGMEKCLEDFVESMKSEDYVLSFEDVLHLQLLLQYFDTETELSSVSNDNTLYLDTGASTISKLKSKIDIGHVRTNQDGPKLERKQNKFLNNSTSETSTSSSTSSSSSGSRQRTASTTKAVKPPPKRPSGNPSNIPTAL